MNHYHYYNFIIRDADRLECLSAVLLFGEPGTGKTRLTREFASYWEANYLFYQCHQGTGREELLYDLDIRGVVERLAGSVSSTQQQYIKKGLLYQAVEMSHKSKTVLVLDEIDKSRPALDGFLLDFLQNGRLSDPYLGIEVANKKNLIVFATSNEERMLSEPLFRRFRRIRLYLPDAKREVDILGEMVPEDCKVLGTDKIAFIVAVAQWQRQQEGVIKKVTTPELARLVSDLASGLVDRESVVEIFLSWFSPHREDWEIILKKFSPEYIRGKLVGR